MSDEAVNPTIEVEESCKPKCVKALVAYEVRLAPAHVQPPACIGPWPALSEKAGRPLRPRPPAGVHQAGGEG